MDRVCIADDDTGVSLWDCECVECSEYQQAAEDQYEAGKAHARKLREALAAFDAEFAPIAEVGGAKVYTF